MIHFHLTRNDVDWLVEALQVVLARDPRADTDALICAVDVSAEPDVPPTVYVMSEITLDDVKTTDPHRDH